MKEYPIILRGWRNVQAWGATWGRAVPTKLRPKLLFLIVVLRACSIQSWIPVLRCSAGHGAVRRWQNDHSSLSELKSASRNTANDSRTSILKPSSDDHSKSTRKHGKRVQAKVRSVNWCGSNGMLPLQIYHGQALDPLEGRPSVVEVTNTTTNLSHSSQFLQERYEMLSTDEQRRLQQKIYAEARASQPLDPKRHLHIVYKDEFMVVLNKPGGILCVPGARRNPSLADLAHASCGVVEKEGLSVKNNVNVDNDDVLHVDKMVVHRLDMDTSGVVVFALKQSALSSLHYDFRQRRVKKMYEALVCGHVSVVEGDIDLPLERDPNHPPFMRVAFMSRNDRETSTSELLIHDGFQKFINQAPKPSFTSFRVVSWEYLDGCPVTRVSLTPLTGRTHQLRVHCAAMGHPIVGDDIYGFLGEGAPNAGLEETLMDKLYPLRPSLEVQRRIHSKATGLCLHAKQLCIHHPRTGAPMIFQADAPF